MLWSYLLSVLSALYRKSFSFYKPFLVPSPDDMCVHRSFCVSLHLKLSWLNIPIPLKSCDNSSISTRRSCQKTWESTVKKGQQSDQDSQSRKQQTTRPHNVNWWLSHQRPVRVGLHCRARCDYHPDTVQPIWSRPPAFILTGQYKCNNCLRSKHTFDSNKHSS